MPKSTDRHRNAGGAERARGPMAIDRRLLRAAAALSILAVLVIGYFVARPSLFRPKPPLPSHSHNDPGQRGGILVPVGHEHFHVEALFADDGVFQIFTLDQDETRVFFVPLQTLTAYIRSDTMDDPVAITLNAVPQPGDPEGRTSAFEGRLSQELIGKPLLVVVPDIDFGKHRYRFGFFARSTGKPVVAESAGE